MNSLRYLGIFAFLSFLLAFILGASGVLAPVAALHLVFAVGVLPLIFGAMQHFVPVLTRSSAPHRMFGLLPFVAQGAGLIVVAAMQGLVPRSALHVAAMVNLLIAISLIVWIVRRARRTLGPPHPGWRWYAASLCVLVIALLAVPPLTVGIMPIAIRAFHLHANTLGFIGLAAFGTLPVLLPTALGLADPQASLRLRRHLVVAVPGVMFVAVGAAWWWPLALIGGTFLLVLTIGLIAHWLRRFGATAIFGNGAVAPLATAALSFALFLFAGVLHGLHFASARGMVFGFVAGFLLPLVSGALSQLLPVWRFAGPDSPSRKTMRARLVRCGRARALLFFTAGVSFSADFWPPGTLLAALGLMLFAADLFVAMRVPASTR